MLLYWEGTIINFYFFQVIQSFLYHPVDNIWRNEQNRKLYIPSQFPSTSKQTVLCKPLAPPVACHKISPDVNYLFSALSYVLTNTEEHNTHIKLLISDHLKKNQTNIAQKLPKSAKGNVEKYVKVGLTTENSYATDIELFTASDLLQTNIYVYCKSGVRAYWKWTKYSPLNVTVDHGIYLLNTEADHFDVVVALEQTDIPSNLSERDYYFFYPRQTSKLRSRKRKGEHIKEVMNKKYKLNDDFRSKKLDSQRQKYASDPSLACKKKQYSNWRYWSNEVYRRKVKCASVVKYCSNSLFKRRLQQYSKSKYATDMTHKEKVKQYSKKKYYTNSEFKHKVQQYSKFKYHTFATFRHNLKASSIKKYATNPLFRHAVKSYVKQSYHESTTIQKVKKQRVTESDILYRNQ